MTSAGVEPPRDVTRPWSRWLIVGAVLAAGLAVVVLLSAWNTDTPGMAAPRADGRTSMSAMTPLAAGADGLRATAAGLTLDPRSTTLPAGREVDWRFTIRDSAGRPVTRFEREQTKLLHLIVVRRDMTDYRHLHPVLGRDGEFSIPIKLARPGAYRVIADFTSAGKRHVLGTDVRAPGSAPNRALPAVSSEALVDGYRVVLRSGVLLAGHDAQVTFTLSRGGRPVEALQRYLGAYGHLVALRAGDLAYSHVHPTADDRARGAVSFMVDLPARASYRLFLQFKARDAVRTVAFTVRAR